MVLNCICFTVTPEFAKRFNLWNLVLRQFSILLSILIQTIRIQRFSISSCASLNYLSFQSNWSLTEKHLLLDLRLQWLLFIWSSARSFQALKCNNLLLLPFLNFKLSFCWLLSTLTFKLGHCMNLILRSIRETANVLILVAQECYLFGRMNCCKGWLSWSFLARFEPAQLRMRCIKAAVLAQSEPESSGSISLSSRISLHSPLNLVFDRRLETVIEKW